MNVLIGRVHPLLVHLPIGILLLAIGFEWLSRKEKLSYLKPAVRTTLLGGAIMAVLSCVSGYILSLQDNYQEDILLWHLALGITTAVVATGLFFISSRTEQWARVSYQGGCIVLFVVISVTGHLGGSLTHGATYITDALPLPFRQWFSEGSAEASIMVNVQDAKVYGDIIRPILEEKCKNCHGEAKQKGGLRLDQQEGIMKGGKKGKTVVLEKPFDSEMIKRIYLPVNHEDHMPPKGKAQISAAEVQLLQWWIAEGAKFDKKVGELEQPETIKPILESLQSSDPEKTIFAATGLPEVQVDKAPDTLVESLRRSNITVVPVTRESNFVQVSFLSLPGATDETFARLKPMSRNIFGLKLAHTKISDKSLSLLGTFSNLNRLGLEHTAVTDEGLKELKGLNQLQSLNLAGTMITARGLHNLESLSKLKKIFVYQCPIEDKDWAPLVKAFPGVILDRGGYVVPTTTEDTTKVTVKK